MSLPTKTFVAALHAYESVKDCHFRHTNMNTNMIRHFIISQQCHLQAFTNVCLGRVHLALSLCITSQFLDFWQVFDLSQCRSLMILLETPHRVDGNST